MWEAGRFLSSLHKEKLKSRVSPAFSKYIVNSHSRHARLQYALQTSGTTWFSNLSNHTEASLDTLCLFKQLSSCNIESCYSNALLKRWWWWKLMDKYAQLIY